MRNGLSILTFVSRRLRLVLVTALLVGGTKVAAAGLAADPPSAATGAARVSLSD